MSEFNSDKWKIMPPNCLSRYTCLNISPWSLFPSNLSCFCLSVYPTKTSPCSHWAVGGSAVKGLSGRGRKTSHTPLKVQIHSKALPRGNNASVKPKWCHSLRQCMSVCYSLMDANWNFWRVKLQKNTLNCLRVWWVSVMCYLPGLSFIFPSPSTDNPIY